jgi:RNA recognition motif-containing protein
MAVVTTELPPDTRSEDVSKFFDGYGKIVDCRVMTGQLCSHTYITPRIPKNMLGFGFVEFENARVRISFIRHYPSLNLAIRTPKTPYVTSMARTSWAKS